jgi:hypothetical protein
MGDRQANHRRRFFASLKAPEKLGDDLFRCLAGGVDLGEAGVGGGALGEQGAQAAGRVGAGEQGPGQTIA